MNAEEKPTTTPSDSVSDPEPLKRQPQPETSGTLSTKLLKKCRRLLAELDAFQSLLQSRLRNPQVVEVRHLRSSVAAELRTLEKLHGRAKALLSCSSTTSVITADFTTATTTAADSGTNNNTNTDEVESRLLHTLRSSNLPFYETLWTIAKRSCMGLVAFGKRFYWDGDSITDGKAESPIGEDGSVSKKKPSKDKRKSVFVDIVADDGEEWVKVSTISATRLLFEMAEKGWEGDDTESSAGEEEEGEGRNRTILQNHENDGEDNDNDDEIELIKLAREMKRAASATRVRYRHPRLRFVIPKIKEGKDTEVDRLVKEIRSYGVTVECGEETTDTAADLEQQYFVDDLDLSHLLPNSFGRFTSTLNVDCTLLLALVSDLSHSKCLDPSPTHHKAIVRQIEIERQQPLLPTELWPAMDGRELVCTEEAAKRMREIVDVIGTDTERMRMNMMMGDPPFENWERKMVLEKFQELSDYQVPTQWGIPIRVVEAKTIIDTELKQGKLRFVIQKVAEVLSDINYSVFLYGWVSGLMTISSNRTVARQIEATIEKHRNGDDKLEGPLVWVCDTARSLIGKEKNRR